MSQTLEAPGRATKKTLGFATPSLLVHDTPDLVRGHAKFPVVVFGDGERLSFPAASRSRSSSRLTCRAEARSYVRTQASLRQSSAVARRQDIGQPSCALRTRDPIAVWLVRARSVHPEAERLKRNRVKSVKSGKLSELGEVR